MNICTCVLALAVIICSSERSILNSFVFSISEVIMEDMARVRLSHKAAVDDG